MAIIAIAALTFGTIADGGTRTEGERVTALTSTIRCPQCRGQSVAESNVTIAREIRADIRTRVGAGETDAQIRQVYIDRFGRSIVLTPDGTGFTGLVWIIPVVAAALAVSVVGFAFSRWRREASSTGEPGTSSADRQLVDRARSERKTSASRRTSK